MKRIKVLPELNISCWSYLSLLEGKDPAPQISNSLKADLSAVIDPFIPCSTWK